MKDYFYDLMKELEIENDGNFSWIIDKSIIGSKMPDEFKKRNILQLLKYSIDLPKVQFALIQILILIEIRKIKREIQLIILEKK